MTVIQCMLPSLEVSSIDQSFAELTDIQGSLQLLGKQIRAQVLKCTGIPTGVGIGSTKTIAKPANHSAKRWRVQTCGAVDLPDPNRLANVLKWAKCGAWAGACRNGSSDRHLHRQGSRPSRCLEPAQETPRRARARSPGAELNGVACMKLEDEPTTKQEICCSRMVGERLGDFAPIRDAVASYCTRAAEKLKGQRGQCAARCA